MVFLNVEPVQRRLQILRSGSIKKDLVTCKYELLTVMDYKNRSLSVDCYLRQYLRSKVVLVQRNDYLKYSSDQVLFISRV